MSKGGVIYALAEPQTALVRYIGQTKNWRNRFRQHCSPTENLASTHRANWLNSLFAAGLKPVGRILEETDDLDRAERRWIAQFRANGADLVNGNDGGKDLSHAHKAKASSPWAGRQTPLQTAQIEIASTVRFCKRTGRTEMAARVQGRLDQIRANIRHVRRVRGAAGIAAINAAMAASG